MNKDKIIVDLCGGTGCWSNFYEKNGYTVIIVTLPDWDVEAFYIEDGCLCFESCHNFKDSLSIEISKIYGIFAAPPCTQFSIARNDTTALLPRNLREGMKTVQACFDIIHECLYRGFRINGVGLKFWALENPTSGYLKRFLGKPALTFHPYEFGDPYTKNTALWGEFKTPKYNIVEPRKFEHPTSKGARDFVSCVEHFADLKNLPEGYCEKTGYSKRKALRSMTPQGFAKAFYEANK